jgi:hypothetical protein
MRKRISPHKSAATTPSHPETNPSVLDTDFHGVENTLELIRFDKKTIAFLSICTVLFFLFVGLKLHNSSIPYWNTIAYDGGDLKRGLVAGTPLPIRSDEWLVGSTFFLSQVKKGFPVANESLGYGKVPLTFGLPTTHLLSLIKPSFWGCYFLDTERAYSWTWNFRIFPALMSFFLCLMLFTRNNFKLSAFGSAWIFLSSAIQWWSTNTELFMFGCVSVVAFVYILLSDNPKTILFNGILLLLSSYSFAMILYPAYLVPLAYFLIALLVGFFLQYRKTIPEQLRRKPLWKTGTLLVTTGALLYLLYLFFQEAKDTIDVVTKTVYPGQRNEAGGNFEFVRLFTDNFSWFMKENKFPATWVNMCELSSFLLLSPIAAVVIVADYIKTRKTEPLLMSVLVFQVIIYSWMFIGFPESLAKISLLNTSQAGRSFFILGFSNVVATILFLAHHKNTLVKNNSTTKIVSFLGLFILSYAIHYLLNKNAFSYFSSGQVMKATIFFAALNWLVLHFSQHNRYRMAFFAATLIFLLPNLKVNPLSQGLAPFFDNKIYKMVSDLNAKDPNAGWVVFGGKYQYANYLKSAGINCFNGVQFTPPMEKLHVLDPLKQNEGVYNRYAHICFSRMIYDERDSISFTLNQPDLYTVNMDPCSPRLKQLGIRYFLFPYKPNPYEVRRMTMLVDSLGIYIYKSNDQ